jgi:hypothetical protein
MDCGRNSEIAILEFCSKLYTEAVRLCLSLGERDAAINIISNMEEMGVAAPEDLLIDVLEETQLQQLTDSAEAESEGEKVEKL